MFCPECSADIGERHPFYKFCGATLASTTTESQPACKVCDRGVLVPKKIFRMSWPVVAIGYILLIPSVLGMLLSVLFLIAVTWSAASGVAASGPGAALSEAFAIVLGITSFVGGLLGWLLVMKKRVLQCSVCRATVSAS